MFRRYVLPWLAYHFYRLWTATWRYRVIESDGLKRARAAGEQLVFGHWHGHELCIINLIPIYKIATMTSTSKDGELINYIVNKVGGATSRGSSTRGGANALKGLIRLVRSDGYSASVAVDGPKGPLHKVKPGIFELSRLAHAKIVPMGAASSNSIVFQKSWNKAFLPKPFARVYVEFGEPLPAVGRDDDAKDPQLAQRLEAEIAKSCQRAAEYLR